MTSSLLASSLVVLLLGTGFPRPNPEHAGPSTAVVFGEKWFVVDAGRGATMRIAATDLQYAKLQAVFLTHLHSDHTAGLPDLFNTSWQFGRKTRPFDLYGPPGTRKLSKAMLDFFDEDIHIRRDIQEKHPAVGATIRTTIVRDGAVVYDDGEVKVTAFAVDHKPVKHAFGYRFEAKGRTVVVSGDMRPNASLVRYAKGADVLVLEAYLPEFFDRVHADDPELAAKLKGYHTTAAEAGELAAAAGVRTLVLTHLIPANGGDAFREQAAQKFKGTIVVGRDLLRIE